VVYDLAIPTRSCRRLDHHAVGSVPARGRTAADSAEIGARLRGGFIRDPSVAVRIEAYRPFFILGESPPGPVSYVPSMTVSAVAIAGGFSPRARHVTG
jgi:polysaccharide export outer membrane protein